MVSRAVFFCIVIFWVTMNVLLWRSEYAERNSAGSPVPVEMVWQKILTAPDTSPLALFHQNKKIGHCHWATAVTEEVLRPADAEGEIPPEGMVRRVTGYRIDFDGGVTLKDYPSRLRFNFGAKFTTNHVWQELTLNLNMRRMTWEVRSMASEKALLLRMNDGTGMTERAFKFADLQNPLELLQDLESPLPLPLIASGLPMDPKTSPVSLGLKWEARNDWFQIGHTSVRAYLLETKILDRFPIKIVVSRVGEILRVELPDEIVLTNDQLITL